MKYITSGSVNALLKLSELDNTKWGKNLSNILAVLEVLSLAGELTAGMKAALKKNARTLYDNIDDVERQLEKLQKSGAISDVEKTLALKSVADLADLAEYFAYRWAAFLKSKGYKLIKADGATSNLKVIDKDGFVRFLAEPGSLERFVKLELMPNKAQYISSKLDDYTRTLKPSNKYSGTIAPPSTGKLAPTFKGMKAYLKNGKLGNGIIPKGYQKEYDLMMSLMNKNGGEIRTFVTSDRASDLRNCWRAMGVTDEKTIGRLETLRGKLKLSFHHLDDLDGNLKSTFQLVTKEIHDLSRPHTGSNGQYKYLINSIK